MTGRPLFLGIDLGTSAVKAIVVDDAGTVVGEGSGDYPMLHPSPTHAEQDPAAWWQATIQAVRQAVAALDNPLAVVALGVTGQMHGTVLLDEANQLLGPAIIWPDQRSAVEVTEITERLGAQHLLALTGSPFGNGFSSGDVTLATSPSPRHVDRHSPRPPAQRLSALAADRSNCHRP